MVARSGVTMAKKLNVVRFKPNANPGVMETLKGMTAAAKAEGYSGIAIAAVDKQGYSHTAYEAGENIGLLIGSVERLKFRLLKHPDGE